MNFLHLLSADITGMYHHPSPLFFLVPSSFLSIVVSDKNPANHNPGVTQNTGTGICRTEWGFLFLAPDTVIVRLSSKSSNLSHHTCDVTGIGGQ